VAPFENVNVYPLVAKLLELDISHLKTGAIDGDLRRLEMILKESGRKSIGHLSSVTFAAQQFAIRGRWTSH